MSTTHTDKHVLAVLVNGPTGQMRFRISEPTTYAEAIARWDRLDQAAAEGRLVVRVRKGRMALLLPGLPPTEVESPVWVRVNCVAVRAAEDPLYAEEATARLLVSPKGHADRRNACKAWGQLRGYEGRKGGWVYRNGRPVTQGWESLVNRHSVAVISLDRRWYLTEEV